MRLASASASDLRPHLVERVEQIKQIERVQQIKRLDPLGRVEQIKRVEQIERVDPLGRIKRIKRLEPSSSAPWSPRTELSRGEQKRPPRRSQEPP